MTKDLFRQQCLRKKRIYQILMCNTTLGTFILPRIIRYFHISISNNTLELIRGLILGIGIVSFIQFIQTCRALQHPTVFDTFYIQETDERYVFIKQKTIHSLFYITLVLILLTLVLASAFPASIFGLLLGLIVTLTICKLVIRYYYASKY